MTLPSFNQLLLAASESEPVLHHDESIIERVGLDWPHLISQIVVFVIVAIALKKYAFDPIIAMLAERRERIREAMENAEKIKRELAEAEATRKEIIRKASEQAGKVIEEAHVIAAQQAEKKIQTAVHETEQMIAKAREAIELDRQKMKSELKNEIASLVVKTTAAVAGKVLTADDQQRLNKATASELAANN